MYSHSPNQLRLLVILKFFLQAHTVGSLFSDRFLVTVTSRCDVGRGELSVLSKPWIRSQLKSLEAMLSGLQVEQRERHKKSHVPEHVSPESQAFLQHTCGPLGPRGPFLTATFSDGFIPETILPREIASER